MSRMTPPHRSHCKTSIAYTFHQFRPGIIPSVLLRRFLPRFFGDCSINGIGGNDGITLSACGFRIVVGCRNDQRAPGCRGTKNAVESHEVDARSWHKGCKFREEILRLKDHGRRSIT